MARDATINVSLTPHQLRLLRQRVESGHYESASEVVRESLRMLFLQNRPSEHSSGGNLQQELAKGYRATARQDRKTTQEWDALIEAWPTK